MRWFWVLLLMWLPVAAAAQDDKGFLTKLLEDNLSGAGRVVLIDGFKGALSSRASFTKMTIADDQGVWLTVEDAVLDWNRAALLSGRLEVNALTAAKIDLARLPVSQAAGVSPTARDIKIPDLPVSVLISKLAANEVTLDAPVLGQSLRVSLEGAVQIANGDGTASLHIARIDGTDGRLDLEAGLSNATNVLSLNLAVAEPKAGILATLLGLPDSPALEVTLTGAAPISDFVADVTLKTDGTDRFGGQVTTKTDDTDARHFSLDLEGDVTPLFSAEYRSFFGKQTALKASGTRYSDGRLDLDSASVTTGNLFLAGSVSLAADGLPEAFHVTGAVTPTAGAASTLLPLPGVMTTLQSAKIAAQFQAGVSDNWTLDAEVSGLERGGVALGQAKVAATGTITRAAADQTVGADVTVSVIGLALDNVELAQVLGDSLRAATMLTWRSGDGLTQLRGLRLSAGGTEISGDLDIKGLGDNYRTDGTVHVQTNDLGRFSAIAGMPLVGTAKADVAGWYAPLGGAFDAAISARTDGLNLGAGPLMALVAGAGSFDGHVARDTGGTSFDGLALQTSGLRATASGRLGVDDSAVSATGTLNNIASLVPGIDGPAQFSLEAQRSTGDWTVDLKATGPGGANVATSGTVTADAGSVDLRTTGSVPVGLLNNFLNADTRVQGASSLDLRLVGPPALAGLSGSLSTNDTSVSLPTVGLSLNNISGGAQLAGGRAVINATGQASGGGAVTISGSVSLQGGYPADLQMRLNAVGYAKAPTYQTTVDGALSLTGSLTASPLIAGKLTLGATEIRLAGNVGSSVDIPPIRHVGASTFVLVTQDRAGVTAKTTSGSTGGSALRLDIALSAPRQIFIRGRGLDAELGGQLRVTGTTAAIVPIGQFDLVRGRLSILGQRLDLVEGNLAMQGSLDPSFRLVASATTPDASIQVVTEGTADKPKLTFTSVPDLPQDEILALLLFGRSIANISALQAAQMAAAVATLAGDGSEGFIGNIRNEFALDNLDVTSGADGTVGVRAGKYLSDKLYADVVANSDGTSEVELKLDLNRNTTVKGFAGTTGDTGIGLFFDKDY